VEAWRALPRCNPNTCLLANTIPVIPFMVATGKAKYPKVEDILAELRSRIGCFYALDAVDLAREAGNSRATNVVMVGVLAGTGLVPISDASWQAALANTVPPKLLDINKKAFEMGYEEGKKTGW
jgi:indolepyruvate ferredoxin oxidoreductase beta subunit